MNLKLVSAVMHSADPVTGIPNSTISKHDGADVFTVASEQALPMFIILNTGEILEFPSYAFYMVYRSSTHYIEWDNATQATVSLTRDGLTPVIMGSTQYARF